MKFWRPAAVEWSGKNNQEKVGRGRFSLKVFLLFWWRWVYSQADKVFFWNLSAASSRAIQFLEIVPVEEEIYFKSHSFFITAGRLRRVWGGWRGGGHCSWVDLHPSLCRRGFTIYHCSKMSTFIILFTLKFDSFQIITHSVVNKLLSVECVMIVVINNRP